MAHRKRFFGNVMTIGVFTHSAQAIGYLSSVLVFKYFIVPEEYGVVAIILVFSGFMAIFADSGISYAVIRGKYSTHFLGNLGALSVIIGISICLLLMALAYPIAWLYNDPNLVLPTVALSLTFIVQSFSIVPKAYLQKQESFNTIGLFTLITQIINSGSQIVLAMQGFSYWSFIWAPLIALSAQSLLYLKKAPFTFQAQGALKIKSTFQEVRSLFGYTSGFNLINYWTRKSDDLLIGKFYGKEQVGVYSQAYYLLTFPLQAISNVIRQVMLPAFQAIKDEGSDVNEPYNKLVRAIGLSILPISILLIIFPEEVTLLLRGEEWSAVAEFLPFFGVLGYLQAMFFPISDLFILHKAEHKLFNIGLLNSTILIISITIGVFFSVRHVAFIYALATIILVIPIHLSIGYFRTFGYSKQAILTFWLPRLLITCTLLLSIWYRLENSTNILVIISSILLIFTERNLLNLIIQQIINLKTQKEQ